MIEYLDLMKIAMPINLFLLVIGISYSGYIIGVILFEYPLLQRKRRTEDS